MPRSALVLSTTPEDVVKSLAEAFPRDAPNGKDNVIKSSYGTMKRKVWPREFWNSYIISTRATGEDKKTMEAYIKPENQRLWATTFSPSQQAAILKAFLAALPNIKRITGQKEGDEDDCDHTTCVGIQRLEPTKSQVWSGEWHQDGYQEPFQITSITYFGEENITARLSFEPVPIEVNGAETHSVINAVGSCSVPTYSGLNATWDNIGYQHSVNRVSRMDPKISSNRSLISFFLTDKPRLSYSDIAPVIEDLRDSAVQRTRPIDNEWAMTTTVASRLAYLVGEFKDWGRTSFVSDEARKRALLPKSQAPALSSS